MTGFYRRRQLAMVAGQDHAIGLQDRDPASRFQRLCGFVDNNGLISPVAQGVVVGAY